MFLLRGWAQTMHKRSKTVSKAWEETLFAATAISNVSDLPSQLPRLSLLEKKDMPHFLSNWNYLHESLAGESKIGLNLLGKHLKIQEASLGLLKSPFVDKRLLAINTLGNLADGKAFPSIEDLIEDRDPVISSWAWRALFRVDADSTIERHLSKIATRRDWSPIFIAKVLKEVESDRLSLPLCDLVARCFADGLEERQMSRLISYLIFTHIFDHNKLVNDILLKSDQKEVLIACLRLVSSDDDLTRIRELIEDERWEIRLQAVITLGRLGHKEDIDRLVTALDDLDWWVRYRAAGALFSMPGMTDRKITKLARTLPSQFSRDVLSQVIAERQLLCFRQTTLTLSR